MRGALLLYVDLEGRVPASHPLRTIREIANAALGSMSDAFEALYAPIGRPSIPPEMLLRALLLLQAFYAIRSERLLMEGRELNATLHVAQNTAGRRYAIDGRITQHKGYAASQRLRKRIEEFFSWAKAAADLRKI